MRSNKQQKKGRNHTIIIGASTKLTYMGVLAMLVLACVGAATGATWVVGDDGGGLKKAKE